MKPCLTLLTVVVAACSNDPLEPGAGHNGGNGTRTLMVEGRAFAEPRVDRARFAVDFTTDFAIRISLNQQPVTTGTVTITSQSAQTTLTWDAGNNEWVGVAANYDEVYQFDIVSGADEVRGVVVDGPDVFAFTSPAPGATLDSTMSNPLTWSREDPAELASFESDQVNRLSIDDTGSYTMGPGTLRAERDVVRENRLEVRRTNRVQPNGALPGSEFEVTISNELVVIAQPNPLL